MDAKTAFDFFAQHSEALSQDGFLPHKSPLQKLPHAHYADWDFLGLELPTLIKTGRIREAVLDCPLLSTEYLCAEDEWRRAYVILTYAAHAYIWGGESPAEV